MSDDDAVTVSTAEFHRNARLRHRDRRVIVAGVASGGSLCSGLPGPVRFSSGEAINLSNNPQLGLRDDALEERISCAHFAVDLASRVQRWVDGSLQAIRGRLEGRKELAVSKRVTDDQEIDVAGDGVCGLCNGAKDERDMYFPSQWRKR